MCSFSCQNACWHDAKILTLSWHGQSVTRLIVKNVKARLFVQLSADKTADQVSGCLCIWENLSQITVLTAQWRTSQNTTSRAGRHAKIWVITRLACSCHQNYYVLAFDGSKVFLQRDLQLGRMPRFISQLQGSKVSGVFCLGRQPCTLIVPN